MPFKLLILMAQLELVVGEDEGAPIEDVNVPRDEPYACGWETCNLWDFCGRYIVIDASSPDCGPCRTLAKNETAWVEAMAARGVVVEWVTLLNASLGNIHESPDADTLDKWVTATTR